jgi:hypothetical protein
LVLGVSIIRVQFSSGNPVSAGKYFAKACIGKEEIARAFILMKR